MLNSVPNDKSTHAVPRDGCGAHRPPSVRLFAGCSSCSEDALVTVYEISKQAIARAKVTATTAASVGARRQLR